MIYNMLKFLFCRYNCVFISFVRAKLGKVLEIGKWKTRKF